MPITPKDDVPTQADPKTEAITEQLDRLLGHMQRFEDRVDDQRSKTDALMEDMKVITAWKHEQDRRAMMGQKTTEVPQQKVGTRPGTFDIDRVRSAGTEHAGAPWTPPSGPSSFKATQFGPLPDMPAEGTLDTEGRLVRPAYSGAMRTELVDPPILFHNEMKLDKMSPKEWLMHTERRARASKWSGRDTIDYMRNCLRGRASTWYSQLHTMDFAPVEERLERKWRCANDWEFVAKEFARVHGFEGDQLTFNFCRALTRQTGTVASDFLIQAGEDARTQATKFANKKVESFIKTNGFEEYCAEAKAIVQEVEAGETSAERAEEKLRARFLDIAEVQAKAAMESIIEGMTSWYQMKIAPDFLRSRAATEEAHRLIRERDEGKSTLSTGEIFQLIDKKDSFGNNSGRGNVAETDITGNAEVEANKSNKNVPKKKNPDGTWMKCAFCGKWNHIEANCYTKFPDKSPFKKDKGTKNDSAGQKKQNAGGKKDNKGKKKVNEAEAQEDLTEEAATICLRSGNEYGE